MYLFGVTSPEAVCVGCVMYVAVCGVSRFPLNYVMESRRLQLLVGVGDYYGFSAVASTLGCYSFQSVADVAVAVGHSGRVEP